jgi:hypothetical protein
MNTREQLIKARLGLLALALEQKNITRACRLAGVSRSHFYDIKRAYDTLGRDGLAPRTRRKPRMPNQTPPDLEQQILAMTELYPTGSYLRLTEQFKRAGVQVTPGMIRYVWQRNGLSTRGARLQWMKRREGGNGANGVVRTGRLPQRPKGQPTQLGKRFNSVSMGSATPVSKDLQLS